MLCTGQFHGGSGRQTFCLGLKIERDKGADWCSEDWEPRGTETMVASMAADLEAA